VLEVSNVLAGYAGCTGLGVIFYKSNDILRQREWMRAGMTWCPKERSLPAVLCSTVPDNRGGLNSYVRAPFTVRK
jgi:hypothetical protein